MMSMLAWRSGNRARRPLLRLLPLIVTAFLISASFGVASIFSSNVTSDTLNQVLLTGKRCGIYNTRQVENSAFKQLSIYQPIRSTLATKTLNYALQCYTNATHTADGCNSYIKPKLPFTSSRGLACPFGDNICKSDNDNLIIDTGRLDSLDDFGINMDPKYRFQLRMVWMCAPLKSEGYTEDFNDTEYGVLKRYMYGSRINARLIHNHTYELPVSHAFIPADNTSSAAIPRFDYQLGTAGHYGYPNNTFVKGMNEWAPIDALYRDDADLSLMFLSAPEIHFAGAVDDMWFAAHKSASEIEHMKSNSQFQAWSMDDTASTLACTQQMQYCNPNLPENERCEPLRGLFDPRANETINKIFTDSDHFDVIDWANSIWVMGINSIGSVLSYVGVAALRARHSLAYGYSAALPSNQWQLESENLVKAALTGLQDSFVEAANGIPLELEEFRQPPLANQTMFNTMCTNQKIVSKDFSSFNVVGVSLILILGILIIILDMGLEPLIAKMQRRKYYKLAALDEEYPGPGPHPLYPAIEWSQTNMLQLQRLAQEEAGYGEWSNCDKDVPVTEAGQVLATIDLRKLTHPMQELKPGMRYDFSSDIKKLAALETTPETHERHAWRSDTGMETLIGEAQEGDIKKGEREKGPSIVMDEITESPLDYIRPAGLGVQLHDRPMEDEKDADWRVLR